MPWRGTEVEQQGCAIGGECGGGIGAVTSFRPEILVVPDILADGDTEALVAVGNDKVIGRRFEIAILVEYIVGREQGLVADCSNGAVVEECGGIGDVTSGACRVFSDEPNQHAHGTGGGGEALKGEGILSNEFPFQHEVARRVAGEGEFREDHEIGAGIHSALVSGEDAAFIAGDIADRGVDLGESDAHGSFSAVGRNGPVSP